MANGRPFSRNLAADEAQRDLAAELLQSVKELKAGQVHVVFSPVEEERQNIADSNPKAVPPVADR